LAQEGFTSTPITWNNNLNASLFSTPQKAASPVAKPAGDSAQLSPLAASEESLTGRVAVNAAEGNISKDQAQQLYGQISSIQTQITADTQADGGTLSTTDTQPLQQLQGQLSQSIYGDAHGGATPRPNPDVTHTGVRETVEAGRIALDQKAGKINSSQAQQLTSQLGAINPQIQAGQQANGGSLTPSAAQAIYQLQNALSQQIEADANPVQNPVISA
jgi:hypothetical protein